MAEITLPDFTRPEPALKGIVIERQEVAGEPLFTVTTWQGKGRPPRRRWFASRSIAMAHAATWADENELLLIDLTEQADDQ